MTVPFLRVDQRSGVPPYLQLERQIRQALRAGILEIGDQLPTVKEVVATLAINPNTVLKAYRELERSGLVEGRPGVGTFVTSVPDGPPPAVTARLASGLERWMRSARLAGLDDEAIAALFQSALYSSAEVVA